MAAGFDLRADRLKKTVMLAVKMRAGVERDRVKREVEAVYDPEGPARLALSLERLFAGLLVIGVKRDRAMQIIDSVAMDSTPHLRLKAYRALNDEWQTTRVIATAVQLPRSTVRRSLEDLVAQGLALRMEKEGGADEWKLASEACPANYTSGGEDTDEDYDRESDGPVPQTTVQGINAGLSPCNKIKKSNEEDFAGQLPLKEAGASNGSRPLDQAALGTLARRYVSIAYDDDGRVRDRRSLKEADADLRANLAELVAADQVTVEVARVLNIVATNPDAGLNPDRGSPTN